MRVGITIATYARSDGSSPSKLRRCLQSIKHQSYLDWKVFLIGDHYEPAHEFNLLSQDLPGDKVRSINLPVAVEREELKLTGYALWCCGGTNGMNQGLRLQRREGIRYTAHLDDDDYWDPNHLQFLMQAYRERPDLAFVYTQATHGYSLLPANGSAQFPNNLPPRAANLVHSSASWDLTQIPFDYTNCVSELRQVFPTDAYMWTKIAAHCSQYDLPTMFIPKVTVAHGESGFW